MKKPLIIKLTPNCTDVVALARAAMEGGADGLSVINTLSAMAIDARRRRPRIATTFGGLSGPAIKPIALRMVYQVHRALPDVPISGIGGIASRRGRRRVPARRRHHGAGGHAELRRAARRAPHPRRARRVHARREHLRRARARRRAAGRPLAESKATGNGQRATGNRQCPDDDAAARGAELLDAIRLDIARCRLPVACCLFCSSAPIGHLPDFPGAWPRRLAHARRRAIERCGMRTLGIVVVVALCALVAGAQMARSQSRASPTTAGGTAAAHRRSPPTI